MDYYSFKSAFLICLLHKPYSHNVTVVLHQGAFLLSLSFKTQKSGLSLQLFHTSLGITGAMLISSSWEPGPPQILIFLSIVHITQTLGLSFTFWQVSPLGRSNPCQPRPKSSSFQEGLGCLGLFLRERHGIQWLESLLPLAGRSTLGVQSAAVLPVGSRELGPGGQQGSLWGSRVAAQTGRLGGSLGWMETGQQAGWGASFLVNFRTPAKTAKSRCKERSVYTDTVLLLLQRHKPYSSRVGGVMTSVY